MKNRLDWYVDGRNMRGDPVVYKAIFKAKIIDNIRFDITFTISFNAQNDWQLAIFQHEPNHDDIPTIIRCGEPVIGRDMAEEYLQEIFDGMKKILDN